jgi:peptidoglycan/xylan/chitin deacetylase (PgdA/CDA1 family)
MIGIILIQLRKALYFIFFCIDSLFNRKSEKVVFCYHAISDSGWRYSTKNETFTKQIDLLVKNGYKHVSLAEIFTYKGKCFHLTFDDGYRSLLSVRDFLKSLNIKPSFFVLSASSEYDLQGLGVDIKKYEHFLTTEETRLLISDGWVLGSHTNTHKLLKDLSKEVLKKEITGSKEQLESRFGINVEALSYPRGVYNDSVIALAKDSGYTYGLTMDDEKLDESKKLQIPRIGIDNTHSVNEILWTSSPTSIEFRKFVKDNLFSIVLKGLTK